MSELFKYCNTPLQVERVKAIIEHGNPTAAANAIGVNESHMRRLWRDVKARAARSGHAPEFDMTHEAAPGFSVKGTSTLYDNDGNAKLQWVKTNQDAQAMEAAMREAAEAFASDLPKAKPVKATAGWNKDLLNQYTITDFHIGCLAWGEETRGDDWDLSIAENLILKWFGMAISQAPNSEVGVFAQMGDFCHFDGMESITPASGHILDADTRLQKMVRLTIKATRLIMRALLEKHKHVHVKWCDANHDPTASAWMREWMFAHYEDEPRVTIDVSPDTYYCYEFGNVSLFYHHGHKRRPANIDDVFVAKFRDTFGRTKFSYAHTGHLHNKEVVSTNLMKIEQHETLAAADAYASRGGWISDRSAQVITYHKEYGEAGRIRLTPEMVL